MSKCKDIKGKKFSKLLVLERIGKNKRGYATWLCKCDCGRKIIVSSEALLSGHTKSCGCLKWENHKTHGLSKTKLYDIYNSMKNRCENINDKNYKYYGARNITICEEWKNNFENFYNWAINSGYREKLSIDRIYNNGNYEPNNCRWVNQKIQSRNRRRCHYITYKNETYTIVEWSEKLNIKYTTLNSRINKLKWSIEKALTS